MVHIVHCQGICLFWKDTKTCFDGEIPVWGGPNGLFMLVKWETSLIFSFHRVCVLRLSSACVTISFHVFFLHLSFPSPSPAGQEAARSGQLKEMIPPFLPPLSLPLSPSPSLSRHYKAPCPLWLLTLTWARKRLRSGFGCVCVWACYRERQSNWVCVSACAYVCVCVFSPHQKWPTSSLQLLCL